MNSLFPNRRNENNPAGKQIAHMELEGGNIRPPA